MENICPVCKKPYDGVLCQQCTISELDVGGLMASEGLQLKTEDGVDNATAFLVDLVSNRKIPITAPRCKVGRDDLNDIVISGDQSISRFHFVITRENNQYMVQDGKSRHGTFLNGNQITTPEPIHDGDVLKVGVSLFWFVIESSGASADTEKFAPVDIELIDQQELEFVNPESEALPVAASIDSPLQDRPAASAQEENSNAPEPVSAGTSANGEITVAMLLDPLQKSTEAAIEKNRAGKSEVDKTLVNMDAVKMTPLPKLSSTYDNIEALEAEKSGAEKSGDESKSEKTSTSDATIADTSVTDFTDFGLDSGISSEFLDYQLSSDSLTKAPESAQDSSSPSSSSESSKNEDSPKAALQEESKTSEEPVTADGSAPAESSTVSGSASSSESTTSLDGNSSSDSKNDSDSKKDYEVESSTSSANDFSSSNGSSLGFSTTRFSGASALNDESENKLEDKLDQSHAGGPSTLDKFAEIIGEVSSPTEKKIDEPASLKGMLSFPGDTEESDRTESASQEEKQTTNGAKGMSTVKEGTSTVPDWCKKYFGTELNQLSKELIELNEQVRLAQQKIKDVEGRVALTKGLRNTLLTAQGDELVEACGKVLTMLGWRVKISDEDKHELRLEVSDDKNISIARIVWTETQADRTHLGQLSISQTRYWCEQGVEPKGILIVSRGGDTAPSPLTSNDHSSELAEYASKKNVCLMTTLQLLSVYKEIALGEGSAETVRATILTTSGWLSGHNLEPGSEPIEKEEGSSGTNKLSSLLSA